MLSGVFTTGPAADCVVEPDCAPWLLSGCRPELATRTRVTWLSAVVDVRRLADGTTPRTFTLRRGSNGFILGGAHFEFWTRDCHRVFAWHSFWDCARTPNPSWRYDCETHDDPNAMTLNRQWVRTHFPIPTNVKWMTVSANDNLDVVWSVR